MDGQLNPLLIGFFLTGLGALLFVQAMRTGAFRVRSTNRLVTRETDPGQFWFGVSFFAVLFIAGLVILGRLLTAVILIAD